MSETNGWGWKRCVVYTVIVVGAWAFPTLLLALAVTLVVPVNPYIAWQALLSLALIGTIAHDVRKGKLDA